LAALAAIALLGGCAIRQDATGISRVGIGLWGFGDPPGVNWNLDWPRREPTALPPRQSTDRSANAPPDAGAPADPSDNADGVPTRRMPDRPAQPP